MRKITQIATATHSSLFGGMTLFVYALCDDGSLWVRAPWASKEADKHWDQIEDVPQPEAAVGSARGCDK